MKVRKKRLEKFKQHAKAILTPYAKEIAKGGTTKHLEAWKGFKRAYLSICGG